MTFEEESLILEKELKNHTKMEEVVETFVLEVFSEDFLQYRYPILEIYLGDNDLDPTHQFKNSFVLRFSVQWMLKDKEERLTYIHGTDNADYASLDLNVHFTSMCSHQTTLLKTFISRHDTDPEDYLSEVRAYCLQLLDTALDRNLYLGYTLTHEITK